MTSAPFLVPLQRGGTRLTACLLPLLLMACGGDAASGSPRPQDTQARGLNSTGNIPLNDLLSGTYKGFTGGLYPQGRNTMPAAHSNAGLTQAGAIQPLNANGQPSANGKYVLLAIGMSHTTQEFCSQTGALPCEPWTFMGRAAVDASVNKSTLAIADAARSGQVADTWDDASDTNYDLARDVLVNQGLSEKQVQIVWLKVANIHPTVALPAANADAYQLKTSLGNILRAARTRYPNLKQVFISSRSYAGYAETTLNPEPYAYESGFAVKWLVEAQIRQKANGTIDAHAGNLDYSQGVAPWAAWGPYLWADGDLPRSDGLTWLRGDFVTDGTHPSKAGESKVGAMLLDFFKTSPHTRCWFLAGQTCP